jgi:hypothetical protein
MRKIDLDGNSLEKPHRANSGVYTHETRNPDRRDRSPRDSELLNIPSERYCGLNSSTREETPFVD